MMKKKDYLKPTSTCFEYKTNSVIAASKIIYEEDSEEFAGLLDDCLRIAGNVSNEELKNYLLTKMNYTECFEGWTEDEDGNKSCNDSRFQDNIGVTIQYDNVNKKFILTFNSCTNPTTNINGSRW